MSDLKSDDFVTLRHYDTECNVMNLRVWRRQFFLLFEFGSSSWWREKVTPYGLLVEPQRKWCACNLQVSNCHRACKWLWPVDSLRAALLYVRTGRRFNGNSVESKVQQHILLDDRHSSRQPTVTRASTCAQCNNGARKASLSLLQRRPSHRLIAPFSFNALTHCFIYLL